ncbi:hypothetical protein HYPSUDRAFT_51199 [Hypholoma sublateritium FD-334 SS-4]|uniref:Uncharacterized protein n=1 Tax=Hypholoma sublateritium (strain FD-334 SS-4) TaxID=945553 RepID=A0A0D2PBX2_HYPSF|nr:hypothetical protein HYPSUDRAFT_51199 [Hypholoma sublateritium FD-334 SS-4]
MRLASRRRPRSRRDGGGGSEAPASPPGLGRIAISAGLRPQPPQPHSGCVSIWILITLRDRIVPASRGYAAREWGHPSRVSRAVRGAWPGGDSCSLRDRTRFELSLNRFVVSPRGCAASGAQGALLATPWTGQDACGLPALVPWSVGRRSWSKEQRRQAPALQPPPGPSRSCAHTCARPGGQHARCHGPPRSGDDTRRRGRPRAPAARAGAQSSHRRPPPARVQMEACPPLRQGAQSPRTHAPAPGGWWVQRVRGDPSSAAGAIAASPLMHGWMDGCLMGAFGDGRRLRAQPAPGSGVAWRGVRLGKEQQVDAPLPFPPLARRFCAWTGAARWIFAPPLGPATLPLVLAIIARASC